MVTSFNYVSTAVYMIENIYRNEIKNYMGILKGFALTPKCTTLSITMKRQRRNEYKRGQKKQKESPYYP